MIEYPDLDLSPEHVDLLSNSAITSEVAKERGYRTVRVKAELERFGFGKAQRIVPALLLPTHGIDGRVSNYQLRPNEPRVKDGKPIKYETPFGSRMVIDVPVRAAAKLGNPQVPLFITEGIRKADSAVSAGLCCIALLGVWNWRGTNANGGKTVLPEFESIAFNGRKVYVAFDSDVMEKESVRGALGRLAEFLRSRGAEVLFVLLPSENGAKVGLDDFLAAGRSVADLCACACATLPVSPSKRNGAYFVEDGSTYWRKRGHDGEVPVQLANFSALIVREVEENDGTEVRNKWEVKARVGNRVRRFEILAGEFASMGWIARELGVGAILSPGMSIKDHFRAATQFLSTGAERIEVRTHTGWAKIGQRWSFIHGGASEHDSEFRVGLQGRLAAFELPEKGCKEELMKSFKAFQRLGELLPDGMGFALALLPFRAVLGQNDFGVFVVGSTGCFKSELASLLQRFFGSSMDSRHLPASWCSTENALEEIAHLAKDALLTIDDFAPVGTKSDIDALHRRADRIFRSAGNQSGRGRMRADGSLRMERPPRALILATGEDLPRGQSVKARTLIYQLNKGSIRSDDLTNCQLDAGKGEYARLLAAFIKWMAPQYEEVVAEFREAWAQMRPLFHAGGHMRCGDAIASLSAAAMVLNRFLVESQLASDSESKKLERQQFDALQSLGRSQTAFQASANPAEQFVRLVGSAISSGRAHLQSPLGAHPEYPESWGWKRMSLDGFAALGECIGWIEEDSIWLDPDASMKVARAMGEGAGEEPLPSATTLVKRLGEAGLLASKDEKRETYKVRKTVGGRRRDTLHVRATSFGAGTTDQSDQSDRAEVAGRGEDVQRGRVCGRDSSTNASHPDQGTRPKEFCRDPRDLAIGRDGRNGRFDPEEPEGRALGGVT